MSKYKDRVLEKREKLQQALERNIIAKNTTIVGDINSEGDFRIDGRVEGSIHTSGRIIIGRTGVVKGNASCSTADVEGKFSGDLVVKSQLIVKSSAHISGEVTLSKLTVEPGADFNANCIMKGSVKELHNEQFKKEKSAS